jgi:hypothetical protein
MNDNALTVATERLATRLRAAEHLLRSDLAHAATAHDLTRAQLIGVEANARRQSRAGVAVTANEFWIQTAQPQAAVLLTACGRVQDEAEGAIGDALWRHGRVLATFEPNPEDADRWRDIVVAAVHRLGPALVPPTIINSLGRWWQNRLRRRAMVLALPDSLLQPATRFPLLVTERELELARRPPWSQGDRLLAAFELAHADLRARAVDIEHDLVRQAGAVIDTVLGRCSSPRPGDLRLGGPRRRDEANPGTSRPVRGPGAGSGPPAMIELP